MRGTSTPAHNARDGNRELREAIRERLARGVYEREKARDPTDRERQSSWDHLNVGRRATRLNYADELLTTIVGAMGLRWSMVESLTLGTELLRGATDDASAGTIRDLEELSATLSALLPRPVR